jgi:hypothetical protein
LVAEALTSGAKETFRGFRICREVVVAVDGNDTVVDLVVVALQNFRIRVWGVVANPADFLLC